MRIIFVILLAGTAVCLSGCSSLFSDPLRTAYESGEISKEEYERRSREQEQSLARSSPAYWQREQTAAQNRAQLNPY